MTTVAILREKKEDVLQGEIRSLQKSYFNLRVQKSTQQLQNTAQLKQIRRSIARARTILTEKMLNKKPSRRD